MERSRFLARVRARLPRERPPAVVLPDDWGVSIEDRVARFEEEVTAAGGTFHGCPPEEVESVVAGLLAAFDRPKVLVAEEQPVPRRLQAMVERAGGHAVRWPHGGRREAESADVGVTGALWGVAETGSIVVSSAPPGGRAPSLLPPVHVAFLDGRALLSDTAALWSRVASMAPRPSNLVVVTGPSKSADIGNELIVGVHGPGELHVVLVEGTRP